MSNQNSYTDVKNGPEEVGEENSKGSSDSFQIAMNNMWALIRLHGKTNVQDDESETSKKFSGDSHSVSDSSPQLPKELPSQNKAYSEFPPRNKAHANKAHAEFPPQNKAHAEFPPQNKTYPEPIPQTDSSSVVAKPQENNSTANTPSASIVKNDDNREGWGWWAAKGLISGGGWAAKGAWSLFTVSLSGAWSVTKGAVELFSLLSKEMQFAIVAAVYSMYKVAKMKKKAKEILTQSFNGGKFVAKATGGGVGYVAKAAWGKIKGAKATGKKLGVVATTTGGQIVDAATTTGGQIVDAAKATGEKLVEAKDTVKEIAHQAKEGVVNLLRGEFKVITLDEAKKLITEGKNDELHSYLIYENQITYGTQPEPQQTEIKIETEEKKLEEQEPEPEIKLEEPEETAQEQKLEAPEGENLVQNTLHRQLLEEAIKYHNLEAVRLLLQHDKSVLKEIGGAVSGKFCNMIQGSGIQDREAKFQGVNIKGDQTLLPKAIVKLLDLRRSLSQLELSHSVVGTTKEVTLESIGQVEITFEPIDNDPYWMQANCVVNKKKNDEYSIVFFCKIARAGTQITNGESAQVNVLESDEFQKFLTKSINDYHDALNIIDCLLQQGADLKEMEEIAGLQYNIPLEEACYQNNQELFIVLLKNQATPSPALIKYTFEEKKPFYDLMANPLCNALGQHLWPKRVLGDTVQPEDDVTNASKTISSLCGKNKEKDLSSNAEREKKLLLDEEIYQQVIIYNLSRVNLSLVDSSGGISLSQLGGVSKKQEEIADLNLKPGDEINSAVPIKQPLSGGGDNANEEENKKEEYNPLNDLKAPKFQPTAEGNPTPLRPISENKIPLGYAKNVKGASTQGTPQYRSKNSSTCHKCTITSSASSGKMVTYNDQPQGQQNKATFNSNTLYTELPVDLPGSKRITLNADDEHLKQSRDQQIATPAKTSVTKVGSPQTPVNPRSIENLASAAPSSQALPVVIASQKNQNSQNNIVSIPKLDKIRYQDLSLQEQLTWQQEFTEGVIQGFIKLNNISPKNGNFEELTARLQKIMHNPKVLIKFKNDIFEQAQNSNSNHQNPFLIMMYGEEKARELSSNPQVLNVSPESCMWVLTQLYIYESIINPLKYAYITRGIKQQKDKDGNLVTEVLDMKKLNEGANQEIQKNNFEKNLIFQLQNGTLDGVSDLFYLVKQKWREGVSRAEMKYLVGGEKPLAIIRNLPFTCLQHSTQCFYLFKRISTNPENYQEAKSKLGRFIYTMCIENNRLLSLMPSLSKLLLDGNAFEKENKKQLLLDGNTSEKENKEPSKEPVVVQNASAYPSGASGANPVPDEEKKEETSKEITAAPNPADDSGASDTNAVPDEDQQNETTKAPDLLIPSASMANDNPEGRQKLKIAEVGEKIGGLLWGPVGKSIGRVFGQALDHIVETSERNANAAQQNVNSGNDRSDKENNSDTCYHNGNNSNLKDTDVHRDPADIQAQAEWEREGQFSFDQATTSHEDCNGNNSGTDSAEASEVKLLDTSNNKSEDTVHAQTNSASEGEGANYFDSSLSGDKNDDDSPREGKFFPIYDPAGL